ncbi:Crp/Fnr family transcriptional regulator [Streptomyces roseolilacinus]|jgi:CRP-like cAMP-binding protein|uniref:Crp/Fnr family transcriptional regulator n=1 Tax=Streptomyces roseolilacinus TaxID=66904 RepID=A0A918B0G5_9ACTN|nr:Crp/Fnr family transcriptional regulator [Streptomyces roseolilacinus]GGQ00054.1 Crp/Fnr family transcriptional regulator [Streptomyces roseolilacinus]
MSLFGQDRSFLEALSAQDRRALLAEGVPRDYEPGTVMIRERDVSAYVLVLLSGWAVVSVGTERGTRLILALRGAGEVVGDLAAVDQGPRSATVTALGRVRAVSVSGDRFRRFLAARPHATSLIMRQLSARLRSADVERRSLASETVIQRLAARLAELAEHAGRPGPQGTVLEIPLPQHDLAAAIGATREAVAKALRQLREQNVVRTGPRQVVVTDMEDLLHLAQGRGPRPAGPAEKSPPGV